jgi:hypothetical protein
MSDYDDSEQSGCSDDEENDYSDEEGDYEDGSEVDSGSQGSVLLGPDGNDGGTIDTEPPDVLRLISRLLAEKQVRSGAYTFGGTTEILPSQSGLSVEGYGLLSLPLVESNQAERLAAVCEQAPYGTENSTTTDTAVRNCWQINPARIHISNPEWQTGLEKLKTKIAAEFGLPGTPITFSLYKFLLYKPGGHFVKHRDTEKDDRMFATMVIQLPCVHEGGDLQASKGEKINHSYTTSVKLMARRHINANTRYTMQMLSIL